MTGGAGFIGSHVVDALLAAGHRPRIFDLRRSRTTPTASSSVRATSATSTRCARAMRGCDAVIHLAAAADVGEVAAGPGRGRAPQRPRHAARARGRAPRRSRARRLRLDDLGLLRRRPPSPSTRTRRCARPAHLYTATKLAGELYCRSLSASSTALEYTVLRFGIPYGPRARPAAVIPQFVREGARRRAADDRRRRQPVARASSTSRTSPTASCARSRRSPRTAPTTSSAPRTSRSREIAEAVRDLVGAGPDRPRPRRAAATSPGRRSAASARERARLDAPRRRSARACGATSRGTRATRRAAPARGAVRAGSRRRGGAALAGPGRRARVVMRRPRRARPASTDALGLRDHADPGSAAARPAGARGVPAAGRARRLLGAGAAPSWRSRSSRGRACSAASGTRTRCSCSSRRCVAVAAAATWPGAAAAPA